MLRRTVLRALPLLGLAAACTPTRPTRPDVPPRDVPPPDPARPSDPPLPGSLSSAEPWRWDRGNGEWGDNLSKRTEIRTRDAFYTIGYLHPAPAGTHQSDERFGITRTNVDGTPRWQAALGEHFVGAGAMAISGGTIYATHHGAISSGASVSAVSVESGQVKWTVNLQGLGPVDHSKYRNETQIEVDERGVVVYGNEAAGAYVEVLDPDVGAQRGHARVEPRFLELTWDGKPPNAPWEHDTGPTELVEGNTRFVFAAAEQRDKPVVLTRIDGDETTWSVNVAEHSSCNRGVLRRVGGQLWVAHYCPVGSGVELLAVDPVTGARSRTARVRGLGPIAHSEYFNEVELDEIHGHVLVRGREAAGRYLEVIDPATGASRVVLTFRD